jgi:hypothetical protein
VATEGQTIDVPPGSILENVVVQCSLRLPTGQGLKAAHLRATAPPLDASRVLTPSALAQAFENTSTSFAASQMRNVNAIRHRDGISSMCTFDAHQRRSSAAR